MRAAVGIVVTVAVTAQAQPITRPAEVPCTVQVLEAPPAVRAEIERWVRAEPRCERELAVRVTPARGGLRLVATGTDGRVRERVVPDASSAAVLVVSWMADDSIDDALDAATPVEVAPTPRPPPPRAPATDTELPLAPEIHVRMPARLLRHRWLSFGASAGTGFGMHAQADVFEHDRWTLGVAGGLRQAGDRMRRDGDAVGDATVFVAYTQPVGPVDLRAQLGLGADLRDGDRMGPGAVEGKAQGGLFVRVHVGDDWGVLGGPLVDLQLDGRALGVSAFVGVERRW